MAMYDRHAQFDLIEFSLIHIKKNPNEHSYSKDKNQLSLCFRLRIQNLHFYHLLVCLTMSARHQEDLRILESHQKF